MGMGHVTIRWRITSRLLYLSSVENSIDADVILVEWGDLGPAFPTLWALVAGSCLLEHSSEMCSNVEELFCLDDCSESTCW